MCIYTHLSPKIYSIKRDRLTYSKDQALPAILYIMELIMFMSGCFLLFKGGHYIVDGASNLARRFQLSELVIGLTLVSIGTSLPEVIVNVISSLKDEPELVIGNIIGSNISNTCLILGATGLVSPILIPRCRLHREIIFYILTMILLFISVFTFKPYTIGPIISALLLMCFAFSIYLFFIPKSDDSTLSTPSSILPLWRSLLMFVLGCGLLPLGGKWLIDSAISMATSWGISKSFIALFAIALGTSLPELVTSLIAAFKKNTELALGNILGSNMFNITLVLGISALIAPIPVASYYRLDMMIMFICSVPLMYCLLRSNKTQISTLFSSIMLLSYLIYCFFIYTR